MPLSDVKVKNAKPGIKLDGTTTSKPYRLSDEKGLYIEADSFVHFMLIPTRKPHFTIVG